MHGVQNQTRQLVALEIVKNSKVMNRILTLLTALLPALARHADEFPGIGKRQTANF